MHKFLTLFVVLPLIGCQTPSDLREKKPHLELTSKLPAKAVATCIAERTENITYGGRVLPVIMRPTTVGYNLATHYSNSMVANTVWVIDLKEIADGSSTRYYKNEMLPISSDYDQAIKECQQ